MLKIPFEKYKFPGLVSESDTGADSFAHLQLGAWNQQKDKRLKKEETLCETKIKLCNMRFEKIKI